MKLHHSRLQILLDKFFSDNCTEEEKVALEDWYESFDEQPARHYLQDHPEEKERIRQEMLHSLHQKAHLRDPKRKTPILQERHLVSRKTWVYTAAACLLTLLIGTWIGYSLSGKKHGKPVQFATTQTGKGQRSLVMLSDGSKVYLNAESKLIYPVLDEKSSKVYLEGEAYFVVANDEKPLIINTSGISTIVKASDCNISAFPEDSLITIAVQKGEAKVSSNDELHPMLSLRIPSKKDTRPKTVPMTKLIPATKLRLVKNAEAGSDEFITYNKRKKIVDINDSMDIKALCGWKDGIMYFKNAKTSELINRLERWYGVTVTLNANGTSLPPFSGEFDNENLNNVLQRISGQFDLHYSIVGKNVYLNKRMN